LYLCDKLSQIVIDCYIELDRPCSIGPVFGFHGLTLNSR
jgi:hypothetical protein